MRSTASYIRVFGFIILALLLFEFTIESGEEWAIIRYPIIWAILCVLLLFAIAIEAVAAALKSILKKGLSAEARQRFEAAEQERKYSRFAWARKTYKKLLGTKPIEQETEIILDHNYDGIRELDNTLPPWWVYLFYATIIFAGIYLVRYHVFDGDNQHEEYLEELATAKAEIEEYKKNAKDLVDVNTVEILTGESDINTGKTIFEANCIACHKVDGGGGIGPNLTDDYWILGGGIKNVFNTISEGGRAGKGMVAWKTDLSPAEMAQVSSYILTLHGTTPADPKEPEGEIWIDPNAPVDEVKVERIDSTGVKMLMDDEAGVEDIEAGIEN